MTDPQFKKLGSWFQRLNRKMDDTRKDLSGRVGDISDKMDLKFERVYRELDQVKVRLTDLENRFEDYSSSEQKEIRIFRLALSKLEDQVAGLSVEGH